MLRVRLDPELDAALDRLKTKGHVNISAWVRSTLRAELKRKRPGRLVAAARRPPVPRAPEPTSPSQPAEPPPADPLPGWQPSQLPDGEWGARHFSPRSLPEDLVGQRILVTTRGGESWTATVLELIHRDARLVQVRHSGKPAADRSHSRRER